ncbi:MAG TPA: SIMPL domain-containing protein [Pyrinomonadaceae bacterium]|nr:SIMPL domain-containing protein [Pyrinomonadaceae bacterium]
MRNLFLLMVVVVFFASPVSAQENVERPLITVSGQAEVRVPPDEIVFTLSVESVDKDMLVAKNKTDASVREILAIARRSNIKDEEVQTSYISVEPRYNVDDLDYDQRRGVKREFVGYRVSKTVAVRLREIPRFDGLLSEFLKAGVTRVTNVEFRDSQIRKHRDQARAMAIKAAQEKAKLLAGEIGQVIGKAYTITETQSDFSPRNATQNVSVESYGADRDADSAIAPGLISVTARVTVSFRLQ